MEKDPTDKPADAANEAEDVKLNEGASLELSPDDPTNSQASLVPDASPSKPGATADAKPAGRLRRIWENFNIYLLLFIVVIIIAGAATAVLYVRNRSSQDAATPSNLTQQNLPADTLQELAANGVQVGDPKQVLNVQSNSVFSGAVLVRGELQVAGGMKIGSGSLAIPEINVGGSATVNELQTQQLGVSGTAQVNDLSVIRNLSVNGNGNFTGGLTTSTLSVGRLQLNGDLTISRHLVATGATPNRANGNALGAGGTSSVSGSDTAGSVTINTGNGPAAGCFATITFTNAYASTPHVIITPVGSGAAGVNYYINRGTGNFSICTTNSAPGNTSFGFDYHVFE